MESVAFEERDNSYTSHFVRSRLYFPQPADAIRRFGEEFPSSSSMRDREIAAMLLGRELLQLSTLTPLRDCCAAANEKKEKNELRDTEEVCFVVFPGAGSWFGQVEASLSFTDRQNGTWLPWIEFALAHESWRVVIMNPNLFKYDSANKRDVYTAHVLHVIKQLPPARKWLFVAYSLGAPMAIMAANRVAGGENGIRIALMDGIEDDVEELDQSRHIIVKKWQGEREHRYTPRDCFKEVTEWIESE